jgi:muramoyltetrapeptide carboxypeptidase LdcA involved in peptidoglycan recycling
MAIKSKKLQKGDTVAIVSPSWGGPSIFPHIYESGIKTLEKLGLKIKEYPSAKKDTDYNYNHPEFRAKDINDAFADSEVKAIFSSIGGDDSIRILPFLDLEIIKKNPKIILGYSDTTTLNTYLNQLGLVTLNGPAIMAGFSQWDALGEKFQEHIKTILFENPCEYNYEAYDSYCEGYLDWSNKSNVGKTKPMMRNKGWNFLQGKAKVQGELFGGCIEVLEFMKSTTFWPKEDFWNGKILFLETSEDKPTPDQVKWMLRNYGMQGIFNKISALLIGRPKDYSEEEKKQLNENVLTVIKIEFKNTNLPIITNMDFGHTDPQWILPQGIKAEIDCHKKEFKLIENIFEE